MAKAKWEKWLKPENLTLLQGWARDGLTNDQIAKKMGIVRSTLQSWIKTHEDISNALKKGKEVVDAEIENSLISTMKKHTVTTTTYKGDIIMDVTYIALCYHYGIIYIILLVLLSRYITKTYSEKEYSLLIIYGVFALLEIYSLNFVICFPMLFGASWIGEKNDT